MKDVHVAFKVILDGQSAPIVTQKYPWHKFEVCDVGQGIMNFRLSFNPKVGLRALLCAPF